MARYKSFNIKYKELGKGEEVMKEGGGEWDITMLEKDKEDEKWQSFRSIWNYKIR